MNQWALNMMACLLKKGFTYVAHNSENHIEAQRLAEYGAVRVEPKQAGLVKVTAKWYDQPAETALQQAHALLSSNSH